MTSTRESSKSLVGYDCGLCKLKWYRAYEPPFDLHTVTGETEVAHMLSTGCRGAVTGVEMEPCSDGAMAELFGLQADNVRFDRFLAESVAPIQTRATLLGIPTDRAAALLYLERERELMRVLRGDKPKVLLGLGSTTVLGNTSANIMTQPQIRALRPIDIEVPPLVAEHFLLTDVKIGKNSQFISPGAVPFSSFSMERLSRLRIRMDVVHCAMFVVLSVMNTACWAMNFQGVVVCEPIAD